MITPMQAREAVQVAKRGPSTEAQRQYAIKTLHAWAYQLIAKDLHLAAGEARRLAKMLSDTASS